MGGGDKSKLFSFVTDPFTIAIYGIRGVYFALIEETKIASHITGTIVGLVSVIGFTPDIFFASIAWRILDASPQRGGSPALFLNADTFFNRMHVGNVMVVRF